jgi:hypothetical protein
MNLRRSQNLVLNAFPHLSVSYVYLLSHYARLQLSL